MLQLSRTYEDRLRTSSHRSRAKEHFSLFHYHNYIIVYAFCQMFDLSNFRENAPGMCEPFTFFELVDVFF